MTNLEYEIIIEDNSINKVNKLLNPILKNDQIVIITDDVVDKLYSDKIISQLDQCKIIKIVVKSNEKSKNILEVENICNQLAKNNISRSATLISLGGGVVGDLSGFIASVYLRGINYIQIPTTLLAQVDSSVGSKVAVNIQEGKNLIGSFYDPSLVIIDPLVLQTLTKRELHSGIAEVIKYGCILDVELIERLENESIDYNEVIEICCNLKSKIITQDKKEEELRKILNFGHTFGHAIEQYYNYEKYTHGEAIAIGMVIILEIFNLDKIKIRLIKLLEKFDLPTTLDLDLTELMEGIKKDKKSNDDYIDLISLNKLGDACIKKMTFKELEEVI